MTQTPKGRLNLARDEVRGIFGTAETVPFVQAVFHNLFSLCFFLIVESCSPRRGVALSIPLGQIFCRALWETRVETQGQGRDWSTLNS
jgi:hypothetical protein